jgi:hypothetical protein
LPRQKLALTKDAYPSIFPSLPKHLTSIPPVKRTDPEARKATFIEKENLEADQEWLLNDTFQNLNDVIVGVNQGKINCKDWLVNHHENQFFFLQNELSTNTKFRLYSNLTGLFCNSQRSSLLKDPSLVSD